MCVGARTGRRGAGGAALPRRRRRPARAGGRGGAGAAIMHARAYICYCILSHIKLFTSNHMRCARI